MAGIENLFAPLLRKAGTVYKDGLTDEQRASIVADSIRTLYDNSLTPIIANAMVGILTMTTLWNVLPHELLVAWTVAIVLTSSCRAILVYRYKRTEPAAANRDARTWGRRYTIGSIVSGVLWGFAGFMFFVPGTIALEAFIVILSMGMAIGAMASHSSHLPAFYGFSFPTLLPMSLTLALMADPQHVVLSILGLIYLAILVVAARSLNRALTASLRLRYENAGLIENLKSARIAAEAASRAKSEFLATMSHELRTPLTAIIGFSEILHDESFGPLGTPQYRDYAGDILESGTHLLTLINDILDLSKAEAGKLELTETLIDVGGTIETVLRLLSERAHRAGLSLGSALPSYPVIIRADERALKQILLNLLSNAIKFTPSGGSVQVGMEQQADGRLTIFVRDTGIGIAAEDIPKAMTAFGQLDSSLSRQHEGTGLGLPLVRTLTELHGGDFRLDSALGIGTTAFVQLPAERIMPAPGKLAAL